MHPFFKRLTAIVCAAVGAIVAAVLASIADERLEEPRMLWITVLAVPPALIVALVAYWRHVTSELRREFDLFTTSADLKPEDLGFQQVRIGASVHGSKRPYVPQTYVPREACHYEARHQQTPSTVFDETAIVERLKRGTGLLLYGGAIQGKTRTLFEVARLLDDFTVVRPRRTRAPSQEALQLLRGRKVLCLLDNLHEFAGAAIDLRQFHRDVESIAACCSIAATSARDPAPEEGEITHAPQHHLSHALNMRLRLKPLTTEQRALLMKRLGVSGDPELTTLATICMRQPLEMLRSSFSRFPRPVSFAFKALHLLSSAGVAPLWRVRVQAVVARVFDHEIQSADLRNCLHELEHHGILTSSGDADPIQVERAYMEGEDARFYYSNGEPCERDFPKLSHCFIELRDAEALNLLARSRYEAGHLSDAIRYWSDLIDNFDPDADPQGAVAQVALFSRAMTRGQQQDVTGEIADYTTVIQLRTVSTYQMARALVLRADAYERNKDLRSAIDDYSAVESLPDAWTEFIPLLAQAINSRGNTRGVLKQVIPQEGDREISDYTLVIGMSGAPASEFNRARINRARAWINKPAETQSERAAALAAAVKDCDFVIESASSSDDLGAAYLNRAVAFASQGRWQAAQSDLAAAARLMPPETITSAQRDLHRYDSGVAPIHRLP